MLYPYAIHYSPLIQRRHSLDNVSKELNIDINLITELDVDVTLVKNYFNQFSERQLLSQLFSISDLLHLHFKFLTRLKGSSYWKIEYINDISLNDFTNLYLDQALHSFSLKNVTLSCQHFHAINMFTDSASLGDFCLIIEDDSILTSASNLYNLLDMLPNQFEQNIPFFLDISNSLNLSSIYSNSDFRLADGLFRALYGQTRCASAYIMNLPAASLISSCDIPPLLPIDWHYSYILRLYNIMTLWTRDSYFCQGSESGLFTSNSLSRSSHA